MSMRPCDRELPPSTAAVATEAHSDVLLPPMLNEGTYLGKMRWFMSLDQTMYRVGCTP
jgi:hypothetical protein